MKRKQLNLCRKAGFHAAVVAAILAAGLVAPAALHAQAPAAGAPPAGEPGARPQTPAPPPFFPPPILPGQTAGKHYENIKILKNIPAEQLIPTMQYIAASLGVQCTYCHVANQNEKDDKKTKLAARKMMTMVIDLNKSIAKQGFANVPQVECYTCHKGTPIPLADPVVPELGMRPAQALAGEKVPGEAGPPAPPKPVENLPPAEQLVDNYEKAIGGAGVSSFNTRTAKGTIEGGQGRPAFEQAFKAPNKGYTITHTPAGDATLAYNGQVVWLQTPIGRVREFPGPQALDQKRLSDFYRTLDLKKSYKSFHDVAKAKVGDHDAYVVMADAADGTGTDKLYFDASSGMLVRMAQLIPTYFGKVTTQYDYSDFRDVDGVKVPFEVRVGKPDALTTYHYTEIKFNAPVEDAKFVKPADKPPATTASR